MNKSFIGTIKKTLLWSLNELKKAGILAPRLESEYILCHVLKKDRSFLHAHPYEQLTDAQWQEFKELIYKRTKRVPLAYILGHTEFFGLKLIVKEGVFVPRVETELLVEKALEILKGKSGLVLDWGCGSGCISVSFLVNKPHWKAYTLDISALAITNTWENAKLYNLLDRINIIHGSNYMIPKNTIFDAILSNPPYIIKDEIKTLQKEVQYEPKTALDGGKEGIDSYKLIIDLSKKQLKNKGFLILELGKSEVNNKLFDLAIKSGFEILYIHKDLSNNDRIAILQKY